MSTLDRCPHDAAEHTGGDDHHRDGDAAVDGGDEAALRLHRHMAKDNERPPQVLPEHLAGDAVVYVRQSTEDQVQHNTGSTEFQRNQARHAQALGWPQEQYFLARYAPDRLRDLLLRKVMHLDE